MNYNFPIAFLDAPEVLRANVTPIPGSGSSPLQVIHDSGNRAAFRLDYIDTTGDFIGVYIGAVGHERLLTIIGNGQTSSAWCVVAAHSRLSLRSMTATPVTNGNLTIVCMGMGWNGGAN